MANDVQTVDVTIVGGGPTGLFTRLLLQRLGVSVCIIDEKPRSLELGRADALNARTQQYLEVAGLLDQLLPLGLKCNTSSTFSNGAFTARRNEWWAGLEHTLHKNFLMIGQPVVERVLGAELAGCVHYGDAVVSVAEDGRGVDVARSTVRRALGIGFAGSKPEMLWAVLDVFADTDFPACPEIVTFERDGQSHVSWIPRERDLARFYVLLDGEVSEARAKASIREHMAPYRIDFRETEWYSTFDVKERIASSFVSPGGRVLLAGDAAHVHAVNGGQGLNTGLADAFGLAWRLAAAVGAGGRLRAGAAETLIRSYDVERRGTAQGVIDVAATLVRDTVHEAQRYVATIERNTGYITGMGVAYDGFGSPLVRASEHGIWRAGRRCPDVELERLAGGSTRLYSETTYGSHAVLFVGAGAELSRAGAELGHDAAAVPYRILPPGGEPSGEQDRTFRARWASAEDPVVVLVRPDMYVGCVGDVAACQRYLDDPLLYVDGETGRDGAQQINPVRTRNVLDQAACRVGSPSVRS